MANGDGCMYCVNVKELIYTYVLENIKITKEWHHAKKNLKIFSVEGYDNSARFVTANHTANNFEFMYSRQKKLAKTHSQSSFKYFQSHVPARTT